jgi:hypothetical protein
MYNSDMPTRAELPSSAQLIRSTLIAIAAAAGILVTVVLPAEYAIDPTGVGRMLGLTKMGEIKQQLAAEAASDAAASSAAVTVPAATSPAAEQPSDPAPSTPEPASAEWRDEVVLTLAPGEAAEVKLTMLSGASAQFEWATNAGHLNSDLHGDGKGGLATSYRKGRTEAENSGTLTAAFDGAHGWFWRNRSEETVTLTLRVNGDYSAVKRVL